VVAARLASAAESLANSNAAAHLCSKTQSCTGGTGIQSGALSARQAGKPDRFPCPLRRIAIACCALLREVANGAIQRLLTEDEPTFSLAA
jgi:hypothetical protein